MTVLWMRKDQYVCTIITTIRHPRILARVMTFSLADRARKPCTILVQLTNESKHLKPKQEASRERDLVYVTCLGSSHYFSAIVFRIAMLLGPVSWSCCFANANWPRTWQRWWELALVTRYEASQPQRQSNLPSISLGKQKKTNVPKTAKKSLSLASPGPHRALSPPTCLPLDYRAIFRPECCPQNLTRSLKVQDWCQAKLFFKIKFQFPSENLSPLHQPIDQNGFRRLFTKTDDLLVVP